MVKNKRIVITGGAGFIGSNLALEFDKKNEVLVVDKFRNGETFSNGNLQSFGHYKNLLGFSGYVHEGDINEQKTLDEIAKFKPDIIYHEAAISDTTVAEQDMMIRTNLNAFANIIDVARHQNAKLVYASSAATYGNAKAPQKVWHSEQPANIYGYSKLMMDKLAMKFGENMTIIGLRYFNVYGKNEYFKGKTASMILQFGLQLLAGKRPSLFEGSYEIKRDFVYIKDVVNANILALDAVSGVYNIGTGVARSFGEAVDILQVNLDTEFKPMYKKNPYKNQYQFHTRADINLTKTALDYEPKFALEDGIKDYIDEIKRIYESELHA